MRFPQLLLGLALLGALPAACSSGGGTSTSTSSGMGGSTSIASSSSSSAVVGPGAGSGGALPDSLTVSGVVTDGTSPVAGALVMQAGGSPDPPGAVVTGADGAFSITLSSAIPGTRTVMAAKVGYRTAGIELDAVPSAPLELEMRFVTPPDNPAYLWADPGTGDASHDISTKFCGHCHTTYAKDFTSSGHADAIKSPLVQDLYAGAASGFTTEIPCTAFGGRWLTGVVPGQGSPAPRCYLGAGVLPDLNPACAAGSTACDDPALAAAQKPTAFGACADCHAAGIDGKAGGRDLLEATGVTFENGRQCDVCHHVADVDLGKPAGNAGALVLQRPRDTTTGAIGAPLVQATFGPLPDVSNGFVGASYQPLFGASEICAPCHEQKQGALVPGQHLDAARWPDGLPTHSTYSEWKASGSTEPCQACHMPADTSGLTNSLDVTTPPDASVTFGFVRRPDQLHRHTFLGPLDKGPDGARLLDAALSVTVNGSIDNGELVLEATVTNLGAGHAIPTGEPLRQLVLLASGSACGAPLSATGGQTVADLGGSRARGVVGQGVTLSGTKLAWAEGAAVAKQWQVVRAVRPTGAFDDYAGIGSFASPSLSPQEKGIELRAPVGETFVVSTGAGEITLASVLPLAPGDLVYLGDALTFPANPIAEGDPSRAVAGRPGQLFARVLADASGARGAPHHRAIDVVSDNRLADHASATSAHRFAIPAGCSSATLTATVLHRKAPFDLALERGWDVREQLAAQASQTITLP